MGGRAARARNAKWDPQYILKNAHGPNLIPTLPPRLSQPLRFSIAGKGAGPRLSSCCPRPRLPHGAQCHKRSPSDTWCKAFHQDCWSAIRQHVPAFVHFDSPSCCAIRLSFHCAWRTRPHGVRPSSLPYWRMRINRGLSARPATMCVFQSHRAPAADQSKAKCTTRHKWETGKAKCIHCCAGNWPPYGCVAASHRSRCEPQGKQGHKRFNGLPSCRTQAKRTFAKHMRRSLCCSVRARTALWLVLHGIVERAHAVNSFESSRVGCGRHRETNMMKDSTDGAGRVWAP